MGPMFNACMQAGNQHHHLGGPPQQPNLTPNESGFYSPAPHFNNQPTPPHPINFNNNQIRNIGPRPPNYCSPIYEFKIYELTKRLAERPENADCPWWDQFVTEFFDDHSTLTISFASDDGPKQHTIGRTLIPRYFRTMFEDGVIDFSIRLKRPFIKEHPNRTATLECDQCTLISQHGRPGFNKQLMHYPGMDPQMKENREIGLIVTTEGRIVLEFIQDESFLRIKTWNFTTSHFQELIPKHYVAIHAQDANIIDQLTKNVTRQGLTTAMVNYLRLCVLLEPMQMIMSRHKEMEGSSPRDCLKNVLYTKWQTNICAPQEQQRPQSKRRKRKSSTPNNTTTGGSKKKNNSQMSPGTPNFPLATQDVMVVGEPSLMGGEFGDEDERVITRLENNQYDSSAVPTNGLDDNVDFGPGLGGPPNSNQQSNQQSQQQQQQVGPPSNQPPTSQQQMNQPPPNQPVNQMNSNNNGPQWSHNQVPQQQGVNGSVNSNNGNNTNNVQPPQIQQIQGNGVSPSNEDKKPSPISQ